MKFLCDNCKAKYQIGDDKVAGKTVRMKCRRCGHSITVSSKVTESSVSRQMPADPGAQAASVEPAPESGSAPRPAAPAGAPLPRAPMRSDDDESTQIMQMPPVPSRPGAPIRPRPAAGAPPPRPSGVGVASPAALRAPPPPRPSGAVAARAPVAPVRELRSPLQSVPKPAPSPPAPAVDPGGVAAAFQRAVADPHATAASSRHPPHEDWYVGVGGQPLGPVRVDVIREKAQLGQVDGDSLVWREGFDEWQPLKKFPELLEVIQAARLSRIPPRPVEPPAAPPRASMTADPLRGPSLGAAAALAAPAGGIRQAPTGGSFGTQAMPVSPDPLRPDLLAGRAPIPQAPIPQAPIPKAPSPFAPAAISLSPTPSTAAMNPLPEVAPIAPAPVQAVSVLADPFAAPAAPGPSKPAPEPPPPAPTAPAVSLSPPVDRPAPSLAPGPSSAELSALIPRQRSGMHPMAYAFIAAAAVFGGVAAYVLFFQQPKIIERQVIVEKDRLVTPTATGAAAGEAQAPAADATTAPSAKVAGGPPRGPRGPAAAPTAGTPPAPGGPAVAGIDTSGFNNGGVGGPSAGNAPAPGGGGQLSQGEMQGVINSSRSRISRQCWEPALAAKGPGTPSTAKVTIQLTISPSGSVDNASASGGDAFPGLASCIQSKMKNLKFPSSGGSSTVAVPFVFAAQ